MKTFYIRFFLQKKMSLLTEAFKMAKLNLVNVNLKTEIGGNSNFKSWLNNMKSHLFPTRTTCALSQEYVLICVHLKLRWKKPLKQKNWMKVFLKPEIKILPWTINQLFNRIYNSLNKNKKSFCEYISRIFQ